ncbi:MAG: hypothetical protein WC959_07585 [Kiritimatiellales bacterium]
MIGRLSSGGASAPRNGGILNNMPPPNPQSTYWAGIDQLTVMYQIHWGEAWGSLRNLLEKYQTAAMDRQEGIEAPEFGGRVRCWGGSIAKKKCRFGIERDDSIILISDNHTYAGTWPNVKVEISGERCLVYEGGADAAMKSAGHFLETLGARIDKESVSRVDYCADFTDVNIKRYVVDYMKRRWTCRSRIHKPILNPDGISLYFGTDPLILRIYDKLGEMKSSALRGAPAKYEHMILKRWGGTEPESAMRVEFQCRRGWLGKNGVKDYCSLVQLSPAILAYLTGVSDERWFRFLTEKPDHKHPERNETSPRWRMVQDAFLNQFNWTENLVQIDPNRADIEALLKQALGVLECAASNRGYFIPEKSSTAPEKYRFKDYNHFEKWFCVMLRNVAADSGRWNVPKLGYQEGDDPILDELEFIEQRINQRSIEYE